MTASLIPISHGNPMVLTKDEGTAAQRTWPFYLSNTADGSPATGKTIAGADFKISKAGGAFGNAVGAVTELSLGWYKMVFDAGDVDTLGALACELSVEAGVDPLRCTHQVTALDLNVATVNPGANGITAATLASDAGTELRTGVATAAAVDAITLATRTVIKDLGNLQVDGSTNADGAFVAISVLDAIDAIVTLSGTWDGSTVTIYTTENPAADSPVWDSAGAKTSDDTITVTGPHSAIKAVMSNDGAGSDVNVSVAIRKAANT